MRKLMTLLRTSRHHRGTLGTTAQGENGGKLKNVGVNKMQPPRAQHHTGTVGTTEAERAHLIEYNAHANNYKQMRKLMTLLRTSRHHKGTLGTTAQRKKRRKAQTRRRQQSAAAPRAPLGTTRAP